MSGRGDDAFWHDDDGYERFRSGYASATRPQTIPPMNGPITMQDGTVVTPRERRSSAKGESYKGGVIQAREKSILSEKPTDKKIDDQAWIVWLEWHQDIPAHQIPMMPETFRKAFREGARWMESKGEK